MQFYILFIWNLRPASLWKLKSLQSELKIQLKDFLLYWTPPFFCAHIVSCHIWITFLNTLPLILLSLNVENTGECCKTQTVCTDQRTALHKSYPLFILHVCDSKFLWWKGLDSVALLEDNWVGSSMEVESGDCVYHTLTHNMWQSMQFTLTDTTSSDSSIQLGHMGKTASASWPLGQPS